MDHYVLINDNCFSLNMEYVTMFWGIKWSALYMFVIMCSR